MATNTLSPPAQRLHWLISGFVERTPGVAHAAVVSADGLPLVAADSMIHDRALELAAITAGVHSIAKGAVELTGSTDVTQTVVEMDRAYLVIMSISETAVLAVLADRTADLGVIGFEMVRLVKAAGDMLTPALRAELHAGW
ncbi:roadblock/LC7 domain-containing protein [Hamadaea tsunoensis]|uniref:roadblock/LC7 domain-containing protein n=1 Tax=Hamadaea tsunoensis TaxID=53368 RepID=UPI000418B5A6